MTNRVLTSVRLADWALGVGLLALLILSWAVLAPGGFFWTAVLAMGLLGAAVAAAVFMRSRQTPTLSQMIAGVRAEPAVAPGMGKREALPQRDGRKP